MKEALLLISENFEDNTKIGVIIKGKYYYQQEKKKNGCTGFFLHFTDCDNIPHTMEITIYVLVKIFMNGTIVDEYGGA